MIFPKFPRLRQKTAQHVNRNTDLQNTVPTTHVWLLWKSALWYKTFCTYPSRDATPAHSLLRQLHFPYTEGGIRFSAWTIWAHLDHHGSYQNFSLGVRIWTKGESGIWAFEVRTAFQRAAEHTHSCPTLSSKNSVLQKDNREGSRTHT